MAEIAAIIVALSKAINLRKDCSNNTKKSKSLIRCLQAVKAPLESIDRAEHDRIQVSHEETLGLLKDVIERAHALLEKQTKAQNYVLKTLRSSNVRDQFHEIQIDLQAHLQTLTLSVGVLSGVQIQKMQVGLDVVKEVNREALEEHLDELRINQGIMKGNQCDILENQNTTHDNQRNMLSKAEVALRNQDEMKSNQDEMKSMLTGLVQMSGNVVSNNTYITNDHSTTTTNNINNVTNNYQDQRSNATTPRKPEPYVKRRTKLHIAAVKRHLSEVVRMLPKIINYALVVLPQLGLKSGIFIIRIPEHIIKRQEKNLYMVLLAKADEKGLTYESMRAVGVLLSKNKPENIKSLGLSQRTLLRWFSFISGSPEKWANSIGNQLRTDIKISIEDFDVLKGQPSTPKDRLIRKLKEQFSEDPVMRQYLNMVSEDAMNQKAWIHFQAYASTSNASRSTANSNDTINSMVGISVSILFSTIFALITLVVYLDYKLRKLSGLDHSQRYCIKDD